MLSHTAPRFYLVSNSFFLVIALSIGASSLLVLSYFNLKNYVVNEQRLCFYDLYGHIQSDTAIIAPTTLAHIESLAAEQKRLLRPESDSKIAHTIQAIELTNHQLDIAMANNHRMYRLYLGELYGDKVGYVEANGLHRLRELTTASMQSWWSREVVLHRFLESLFLLTVLTLSFLLVFSTANSYYKTQIGAFPSIITSTVISWVLSIGYWI
ncbi:hypothetical protein [Vibrio harveyi]|uniref:hypothetical protein n=1 Tax=Vibrio harveyi TaxID=669 RepID=UPI00248012BD|nr:hypothetical protein [Vibrio harveyi]